MNTTVSVLKKFTINREDKHTDKRISKNREKGQEKSPGRGDL